MDRVSVGTIFDTKTGMMMNSFSIFDHCSKIGTVMLTIIYYIIFMLTINNMLLLRNFSVLNIVKLYRHLSIYSNPILMDFLIYRLIL